MAEILLTNGFRNFKSELGISLSGQLLEGKIEVGDNLIVNDNLKIPIIELDLDNKLIPEITLVNLTIPKTYNNSTNWSLLYNTKLKIEKCHQF